MLLFALIIALIFSPKFRKDVINKENQNGGKIFNFITFSGTVIFVLSFLLIAIQYKILDNSIKSEKELCETLGRERLILKLNGDLDTRMHERLYPEFKIIEYDSILISSSRNAFIDSAHQRLIITTYDGTFHLGYISMNNPALLQYFKSQEISISSSASGNEKIKQIAYDLLKLRTRYESIDDSDPTYKNLNKRDYLSLSQVRQNADKLKILLESVRPEQLTLPYELLRNSYLAYLNAILAQHESKTEIKRKFWQNGLQNANRAMQIIDIIYKSEKKPESIENKWLPWVKAQHLRDILHMTRSWLYAIEALADGHASKSDSIRINDEYQKVTDLFLQDYPLYENPSLRFFISKNE
jgi:hypothetical protein